MNRPGFLFCCCPDPLLIREHVQAVLNDLSGEWAVRTLWCDDGLSPSVWEELGRPGLFGEQRAVLLRRCDSFGAEEWKKFSPLLARPSSRILPVFCLEKPWERGRPPAPAGLIRRPFWELAEKKGWIWRMAGLRPADVTARVAAWRDRENLRIQPRDMAALAARLPLDAVALEAELEKLALAAGEEKSVSPEHLRLVSREPEIDIFSVLTSLQGGRTSLDAWKFALAERVGRETGLLFPFIGLLAREARTLMCLDQGETSAVRLPPRILSAKQDLARRLGRNGIALLFDLALSAELGVKTGRLQPLQALEELLLSLSRLLGPSQP